jgi:tight adherence protein C
VILLALGSILVAVGLVLAFDVVVRPSTNRRASLRRVVTYATVQATPRAPVEKRPSFLETVVPLLSRIALRLTPRIQSDQLEDRLSAAGVRRLNAQQFLALKTILASFGIVLGLAGGGISLKGFGLAFLFMACGLLVPDMVLVRMMGERAKRLSAHLPQAIDQIAISLEAGLGFDAAVSYFVRRSRSPLAGEFRTLLTEIRMGEPRTTALKRLSERVRSDDMRKFVQTLVQSEGVGISRTTILRNQAEDLRQRRQSQAEERAQKAPVKMLFPIAIFILPVMFIVILGPTIKQASDLFSQ